MASSLGKMPTTSVRRLISPLTRSIGLVECSAWCGAPAGRAHVGEHVALGLIHQLGELLDPRAQLVGDLSPLGPGSLGGVVWAKAVPMKAETTRRPCLPAWASTLRMK